MTIFQAIVYGIVQGIGEFLPISSTAHLVLVPWLLGWKEMPASFDVALHLGTSVAVILFFFGEWISLIKNGLTRPKSSTGNLFWMLVIATIPGGLFGVALSKYADKMRNPAVIGVMLIIMGIVLYYADKNGREDVEIEDTGVKRSIAIGLSQVFAIIPGVSRSGITMTAGRAMGMKREDIAKFTFLLSTPIILGDALYHAKNIIHTSISVAPFMTAIITSAIVGCLSIKFLLNYLKKKGFGAFAIYRFIFGAAVIAVYFIRG